MFIAVVFIVPGIPSCIL